MSKDKTRASRAILEWFSQRERSTAEVYDALELAVQALEKIANCPEGNCEKYVEKVDALAVGTLITLEALNGR